MNTQPLFTIIFGLTSSGKTDLAISLAKEHNANILSFDSRQIYKGMDIGTGKDLPVGAQAETWSEHTNTLVYRWQDHLLFGFDIVSPDKDFSQHAYYRYAEPVIAWHRTHHKPLVLVGGTWPYASVLLNPPASLAIPQDNLLRDKLAAKTTTQLQTLLQETDIETWERLNESDRANPRRLIRALEVARWQEQHEELTTLPPLLTPDQTQLLLREIPLSDLEPRLQLRIQQRLQNGMIEEVQSLRKRYNDWSTPAFTATGYKLTCDYLDGHLDEQQLQSLWFTQERQYAVRQLTWLKKVQIEYVDWIKPQTSE